MTPYQFLFVVAVAVGVVVARPDDDKFPTKYDDFDVDAILNNRRLLENYVKCLIDAGTCTKEGTELKKYIPDALTNECSKCSEKQKKVGLKVVKHVYENEKDFFKQVEDKYDPEGLYRKRYAEQAKKEGIAV